MIVFEHWFTYTTPLNFTRLKRDLKRIIKAFSGMCVRLTSITFPVIWSSVLLSVAQEWRYCGLVAFFRINNIEIKCSFVRCRKYHKSWWNGAAQRHISVDLLCGLAAAELHNSVDVLCGTTAASLRCSRPMHSSKPFIQSVRLYTEGLERLRRRQYDRLAKQLSRFTLQHNGRRAKQPDLMHAPGVARIFQRKMWRPK